MEKGATNELPDVQNQNDDRDVPLWVGVRDVSRMQKLWGASVGETLELPCSFDLYGCLPANRRGAHMSRFIGVLNEISANYKVGDSILSVMANRIFEADSLLLGTFVELSTVYPVDTAGVREGYSVSISSGLKAASGKVFRCYKAFAVSVPVMTVCPCALEVSEYLFSTSLSHTQRAVISCVASVSYDPDDAVSDVFFEDIVDVLALQGSSPLSGFLRRSEEASMLHHAYTRPRFIEDAARDSQRSMDALVRSVWDGPGRCVVVQNSAIGYESIHRHNVCATTKNPLPPF